MPRVSKEALSVVTGLPGQRPQPPARLRAEASEIWREIVGTKPHDWFNPDTHDLLEAYCGAVVAHRRLAAQMATFTAKKLSTAEALIRYDRLTKMADRQVRVMASIATKLRLTNQSRYTPQAASTAAKKARAGAKPWESDQ